MAAAADGELARGLAVIRAFDAAAQMLTAEEVADRAGLDPDDAAHLLGVLTSLGYLEAEARAFRLTPRVLGLGIGYLSSLVLPRIAQPHLDALASELGESVSAAVLDGASIVYVARAAVPGAAATHVTIGTRLPAHAAAMGRAMLAQLPAEDWDARLEATGLEPLTSRTVTRLEDLRVSLRATLPRGWCEVDGEVEHGLRSVAVPVHGLRGVAAAIGVTTPSGRGDARGLAERLAETVRAIEDELRAVDLARPES
ncbi:IclR family transcriptional regulator domain-containing protein [Demequina subtropica]|uniref:IclR family transcriptional regulator domain-containing protein n=1 Tax=Demequina subtropica TaxID=1638989 RepID=UPI0009E2843B|nr:IclR family transcriptional regulator C-terminal domain-containing protein [Demequina subtropica]